MESPVAIMVALVIITLIILSRIQRAAASHVTSFIAVGEIAGSVTGAVVLVVIIVLIYRKCQQKVKVSKDTGVHLISSKFSGSEGNEDSLCRVDYKNPSYTTPLPDTTSSNIIIEDKSCDSATGYNTTKRSDWTSDAYDILSDYKKPRFDSTYDHLPTNVKEECGETYVKMHNRCDANQKYEDMAINSSGVDDKTNVAS